MKPREILFIGDAWDTLDHARDSSLHLARVATGAFEARGYWALPDSLVSDGGVFSVELEGELVAGRLVADEAKPTRRLDSFHSVHWRVDPPVDLATMRAWALLAAATTGHGVRLVNSARSLLTWGEKFSPARFKDWAVPGLISRSERAWKHFFERHHDKRLVVKPVAEAASRGVQFLPKSWDEALVALRELNESSGPWLVLQEFDSALLSHGETRVFVVGADVCGAINKQPNQKHLIMSLDVAEQERPLLRACQPSDEQRRRAAEVAKALAADGARLATIDFIADRILEINVTSPGLVNWIDEHLRSHERVAYKYWKGIFG